MLISRAGDIQTERKPDHWKAETLGFPLVLNPAPGGFNNSRYGRFEIGCLDKFGDFLVQFKFDVEMEARTFLQLFARAIIFQNC